MRNYIMLFLLFVPCGCTLTVDVDIPRKKESLVVNSLFTADSLWAVQVSYDRQILDDTPFKFVENAEVVIYDESGPVEILKPDGKKIYRSATNKPVPGKRYEIRVSTPGHDPVSAVGYVPRATEIVSVKTHNTSIDDDPYIVFDITIKDDPAVENYYRVFVASESYSPGTPPVVSYQRYYIESNDPLQDDENNSSEGGILMKDAVFNGKEALLSVRLNEGPSFIGISKTRKRINVQTLTREAYDYLLRSQLQYNTSDDPFAQPVNVFNNIAGGFGIFAGYNQSVGYADDDAMPVITSITPMAGRIFDEVVIEGINFVASPYKPNVLFSGGDFPAYATVMESSPTRIKVQVPDGAITGPITVFSLGRMVTSKEDFIVLGPPAPVITNIVPMSAHLYEVVTIYGSDLAINPWGEVRVFFSGAGWSPEAPVFESSPTYLKVTVPQDAVTGPITISTRGQTIVSKDDFVVIP